MPLLLRCRDLENLGLNDDDIDDIKGCLLDLSNKGVLVLEL